MVTIEELLRVLIERRASDLHISAGSPPRIRIDGILVPTEHEVLDAETLLDRVNAAWQGDSFHGIMGLDIVL